MSLKVAHAPGSAAPLLALSLCLPERSPRELALEFVFRAAPGEHLRAAIARVKEFDMSLFATSEGNREGHVVDSVYLERTLVMSC